MMKAKLFIAKYLRIAAARLLQLARRLEFVAVIKEAQASFQQIYYNGEAMKRDEEATTSTTEELVKGYELKR